MNRILSIAVVLLVTASAFATDRFNRDPEQMSIATTGRILKIDAKNRTMKVRGSEGSGVRNVAAPDVKESLWQRIGVKMPNMRMPGGITISLAGRTTKVPATKPDTNNLNEYTVVTNSDTVFQDGLDSLRFEDFKSGETISIHGLLNGSTLTASRIAKWD
jgi:Domain of unknown function (DUF5666)